MKLRKLIAVLGLFAFAVTLTAGCNTTEGAGEDLEAAGDEIEETAE